ncbi:replication-relaxation family protein [Bacillus sp. SM2101]|uniref:replication-relaxation family protein n=1 Tax=Bacillus sp. SM2101 TaxID=2805366 RepID=UPI001BDEF1F0|nr:replication-relaxation family protein [Bacillus sp. SM2101]
MSNVEAMAENHLNTQELDNQYWTDSNGQVLIWDDPSMVGGIRHPKKYKPLTTVSSVLNKYQYGILKPEDVVILKVLGDVICANENQMRRYLELNGYSRSMVSDRLKRFRELGLVDRWFVSSQIHSENRKPPAPFTIGIGGFNLLKHHFNESYFVYPEKWFTWGVKVVQRYVAMNEVRLQLAENRYMSNWTWNAVLAGNPKYTRPHGVAELKTAKQGNINLIIERAQQTKDFISFFKEKIDKYTYLNERYGSFQVHVKTREGTHVNTNKSILVLYCSTRSIAIAVLKEIQTDNVPFPILFLIEEDMKSELGINKAFFVPKLEKLRRFDLPSLFSSNVVGSE